MLETLLRPRMHDEQRVVGQGDREGSRSEERGGSEAERARDAEGEGGDGGEGTEVG